MYSARDDYLLRSRWGHVPRTPRAGPRGSRPDFAPAERPSPSRGRPRRGLARVLRRPGRDPSPGELDIHAYLQLEFAVDDER